MVLAQVRGASYPFSRALLPPKANSGIGPSSISTVGLPIFRLIARCHLAGGTLHAPTRPHVRSPFSSRPSIRPPASSGAGAGTACLALFSHVLFTISRSRRPGIAWGKCPLASGFFSTASSFSLPLASFFLPSLSLPSLTHSHSLPATHGTLRRRRHPPPPSTLDTTATEPRPLAHLTRHLLTSRRKKFPGQHSIARPGTPHARLAFFLIEAQSTSTFDAAHVACVHFPFQRRSEAGSQATCCAGTVVSAAARLHCRNPNQVAVVQPSRRPTATCHGHPAAGRREDAIIAFVIPPGSVFRQLRPCFPGPFGRNRFITQLQRAV